MRELPKLADATIVGALEENYGISIRALTFLPLGADSASAAFRVRAADGATYFLKVRAPEGFGAPSLVVPRFLDNQGIPHIASPLPTSSRALWVIVDHFALSLFPFIEGLRAADVGLSEQQWTSLGATLKQIHECRLTPDLMQIVPREVFKPTRRHVLTRLEAAIRTQAVADPMQRELAAFWTARQEEIRTLVDRADMLGHQLRQRSAPLVLCHADLHTWNLLLDTSQQFWIVDWDETILALKGRDLMFVVGGIGADQVRPHETACFLQGYGDAALDPVALTYYRYAWAVQDMGAYGEQVFFMPDLTQETRHDAVEGFVDMFEPGNIVAIALGSNSEGA